MADVKKIGEYYVKDETARNRLNTVESNVSKLHGDITSVQSNISSLTTRIESVENSNLSISYNAETETITFN